VNFVHQYVGLNRLSEKGVGASRVYIGFRPLWKSGDDDDRDILRAPVGLSA